MENIERRSNEGFATRVIPLALCAGILAFVPALSSRAGEYFTEETTSSAVDIVRGWNHTQDTYTVTVTNSTRSRLQVPLEISGAQTCGLAALALSDGSTLSIGSLDSDCTLPLFPYLDRLINQQVETLLLTLDNQLVEIPTTAGDRLALARVANQSREIYLTFQDEVAKAVAFYTGNSTPPTAPATAANPAPSTAPPTNPNESANPVAANPGPDPVAPPTAPEPIATPAPVAASPAPQPELVIVGEIREEAVAGGSKLVVQAINTSTLSVLSARARFEFTFNNEVVDTRTVAFTPGTVDPGVTATAEVIKTEQNWDAVSVSFVWDRPIQ
ncbi:hypothetical protein [Synechococcus sp. PCC 7336]|uniref:hypothetical protein n=1 Tax=Synechococcus sp. PCC 7336 TaxID=195250 RepID=UPI00034AA53D|nr:hypothetical protein [Synechococcus sp. PCC 7336]